MTPGTQQIYLDHNATSHLLPQAAEAMARVHEARLGNPASPHWAGRKARQILEDSRDAIAEFLGARSGSTAADRVIFTSGGTESNNLALWGLAGPKPAHAIVSAIEHPSLAGPADELRHRGWVVDLLPVSATGVIEVEALVDLLRPDTRLVSLMLANNETGVVQPVARAAEICASRGIPLHTDAVQAAGKLPIDIAALGVAALSASAHKFGGPTGVGLLLVRHEFVLKPLHHGGFQQAGLRPGTEPVALVAGMHAALACWQREREAHAARLASLRDEFEARLRAGWPELIVNGGAAARLPHVSNVSFPGLDRQALVMALDLAGVSCSTGSACASGSSEPSPTLVAMGCSRTVFDSALRFSLGATTTAAEMAEATDRILKVCNELRAGKLGRKIPLSGRREGANLVH
ncbi:MAG TPA: cysteine desulfurase family protein [Pirellulales bacterium]|nr:cysteine desulfurase family protein [Pirellulales bacterium]